MIEMIVAIVLNSSECRVGEVRVVTPYGDVCLTKEQADRLRSRK